VIVAGRRKDLLDRITTEHPGSTVLVLDDEVLAMLSDHR
jgi:hypothetical protein